VGALVQALLEVAEYPLLLALVDHGADVGGGL
jgi:hypothetical protein